MSGPQLPDVTQTRSPGPTATPSSRDSTPAPAPDAPLPAARPLEPPALHDRAIDNLRFIRETMERAGSFTAVSGVGIMAAGGIALTAAVAAARAPTVGQWVATWVGAAGTALVVSTALTVRKARSLGLPIVSGPGRKVVLAFSPALVAGALLTAALGGSGRADLLAGMWLLLYGAGVMAAGAFSVPVVPVLGACCLSIGAVALAAPAGFANWCMLAGFGVLHLVFGFAIARRYGG